MIEERKNALIALPETVLQALDREAANEKRSRSGQLEMLLRERYELPLTSATAQEAPRATGRRKRAA